MRGKLQVSFTLKIVMGRLFHPSKPLTMRHFARQMGRIGMKVLIQECYTGAYFVRRGDWTFNPFEARHFSSLLSALRVRNSLPAESTLVLMG